MSIVTTPARPIKSSCNWNAAGNPVIYKFQRTDQGFTQINNNGGFAQVQMVGDSTSYWEVGNQVHLHSVADVYFTNATITASSFSGGNTLVTIDVAYIANDSDYAFINLSKSTDWRLLVDFKRGVSPNDSLLNNVPSSLSHDLNGIVTVDASILKNLLAPDWDIPAGVNAEDENAYLSFYISYQEYYDGALQGSVTNDSSNIIYIVHGANQIGHIDGSNMLAYYPGNSTSKLWLSRFALSSALQGCKAWHDWPATVSFIWPNSLDGMLVRSQQYNSTGTLLQDAFASISGSKNKLYRISVGLLALDAAKTINLTLHGGVPITDSTPGLSGSNDVDLALGTLYPAGSYNISLGAAAAYDMPPSGVALSILAIQLRNSSSGLTHQIVGLVSGTTSFVSTSLDGLTPITSPISFDQIRMVVSGGADYSALMTAYMLLQASSAISIELNDACEYEADNTPIPWTNPVMLVWRNSLGGDACWLFQKYSEYTYSYQNGRKAPRMTLFASDLTPVQWQAIQELHTVGEVHTQNIVDLENTNTINKTTVRVGASVYMIDKDGNKTGVVVIPQTDKVLSRNVTHSIAIEIELPEVQAV